MRFFYKTYALFLAVLIIAGCSQSRDYLSRADKQYKNSHYKAAIPLYLNAYRTDTTNSRVIERLAISYKNVKDFDQAEKWFSKAVKINTDNSDNALYYAQVLATNGKYQSSDEWYKKHIEYGITQNNEGKSGLTSEDLNELYADSTTWKIDFTSINSVRADFSPAYFKRGLVFTTNRNPGTAAKRVIAKENVPFTDLYFVEDTAEIRISDIYDKYRDSLTAKQIKYLSQNTDDTPLTSNDSKTLGNVSDYTLEKASDELAKYFTPVLKLSTDLNSKYHDGPVSFAQNGTWAVFNRNNYYHGKTRKSKDGTNKLKLYSAKYSGGEWYDVKDFPYNSDEYSNGHPALSEDGRLLYFVSDMPGGFGGTDIYYSIKADTGWTQPINLGDKINTKENEMFPYVDAKNDLYFSSTGLPGLGGLDIFYINLENNLPAGKPKNVGFPVNSTKDDFGIIMQPDKLAGYFSSNRKGTDDIYKFSHVPVKLDLRGVVIAQEQSTERAIEGVQIILSSSTSSDTLFSRPVGDFYSLLERDKNYEIEAVKQGYETQRTTLSTFGIKKSQTLDVKLFMAKLKEEPVLAAANCAELKKKYYVDNIYYGFDKSNIETSAKIALDKLVQLMQQDETIKIIAASHTDSRGNNAYNEYLSSKRSKAAKAYLVSKGIDANRVETEYFGETRLLTNCGDGKTCSKENQRLNRRTEFYVVKDGINITLDCKDPAVVK